MKTTTLYAVAFLFVVTTSAFAVSVDRDITADYVKANPKEFTVSVTEEANGLLAFTVVLTTPDPRYVVAHLVVRDSKTTYATSDTPSFTKNRSNTFHFSIPRDLVATSTFSLGVSGFADSGGEAVPLPGTITSKLQLLDFVPENAGSRSAQKGRVTIQALPGSDVVVLKGPKADVEATEAALSQQQNVESKLGKQPAVSDQNSSTSESTKIDKTTLNKVPTNFQTQATVSNRMVNGGGIIERIEGETIHLRSGDHFVVPAETMLLQSKQGERSLLRLKSDLLEPGMAIAYSIRDGKVERLFLVGIVEQAPAGQSVFDTIKKLQLRKGHEMSSSGVDGRNPIRLTGKDGEVTIKIGETKLIELAKPTELIEWRAGDFKPEAIDDIEPFDYVLVQWRDNGRLTWACYASPTGR